MIHNPFIFDKGYQERYDEFSSILSTTLKPQEIQYKWTCYVELAIEPVGWQAIWKMSRNLCNDLNINFPCTVIVYVEHVNFSQLSCLVSINEVEDYNISLPQKMADVPLIELWPTKEQDSSSALSLYETAEVLDCLRFFYSHLWLPWDLDFDEDISWVETHLDNRLQLYFSVVERKVPHEVGHTIHGLVSEGRRIKECIENMIEDQISDGGDGEVSPTKLLKLTELHNQLCNLKNKYTVYEKPHLLGALLEKKKKEVTLESQPSVHLVLSSTTPEQLLSLAPLTARLAQDNKLIRIVSSLQDALVQASPGGSVLVTHGHHCLHNLANLEEGGSLLGVEPGVVVTDEMEGRSTLNLLKGSLTLSDLTLHMTTTWNIIELKQSVQCHLSEVKLRGSRVTDGIEVNAHAQLSAVNCHFHDCHTAIVCYPYSTVTLVNCTFTDNNVALQLSEGCNFSMERCTISGSKQSAVQVLSTSPNQEKISIGSINSIPKMKEFGTVSKENALDLHILPTSWLQTQNHKENGIDADLEPE